MAKPSRISVVTERGQVSIADDLRHALALEKGRRLLWERVADSELPVVVLPITAKPQGA